MNNNNNNVNNNMNNNMNMNNGMMMNNKGVGGNPVYGATPRTGDAAFAGAYLVSIICVRLLIDLLILFIDTQRRREQAMSSPVNRIRLLRAICDF